MSATIEELYSLLVPLASERLIVPRACVAEVVRYSPAEPVKEAPAWFLGHFPWNGRELPLISFEALLGRCCSGGHRAHAHHRFQCHRWRSAATPLWPADPGLSATGTR